MLKTIALNGFKSFYGTQPVVFGKLTILAGANSSGKSTLLQPLLLMKQTLESPFDPGALLLEGPNVRITSADQILSKQRSVGEDRFSLVIELSNLPGYGVIFKKGQGGFSLHSQTVTNPNKGEENGSVILSDNEELGGKSEKVVSLAKFNVNVRVWSDMINREKRKVDASGFTVVRDRCFMGLSIAFPGSPKSRTRAVDIDVIEDLAKTLKDVIHVPGLRGNPERNYKTTAVGRSFPGTFDNYVASVIQAWQISKSNKLQILNSQLARIGLNSDVGAVEVLDTRVAIKVSRISDAAKKSEEDRVSIADVGLGVSQVLPFLVALLVARREQIVYVEQPELHLHPAAQHQLASVLQEAVSRGVQVIMETHSSILLRGIQTSVARGEFKPEQVVLNWFTRDLSTGTTRVSTKSLGADGAIGDWPADFDQVTLAADAAYFDAAIDALPSNNSEEDIDS